MPRNVGAKGRLAAPYQRFHRQNRTCSLGSEISKYAHVKAKETTGLLCLFSYGQYFEERMGVPRSFSIAAAVDATLWMARHVGGQHLSGFVYAILLKSAIHRQNLDPNLWK